VRQQLIVIPFHDWRKCVREGFRTRDAHLIEAFARSRTVESVLVVSRPITRLELAMRGETRESECTPILRGARWHVIRDPRGCYVFEYFDPGVFGQVLKGRSWFFQAYGSGAMTESLLEAVRWLEMDRPLTLAMSIRCARLAVRLTDRRIPVAFDAWDNWLRFPVGASERRRIRESYATFARIAPLWFTNSELNRTVFMRRFSVGECVVVRNGVDFQRFRGLPEAPKQLDVIPRPRALFGGKITHLFDVDLFNEVTSRLPRVHFVVAGQIIDKTVWRKVRKRRNVHYLGDIHYDDYPAYVAASDTCIAPYVREEKAHGGDSIKLYEYAAARRRSVSTGGNGARELSQVVSIANSPVDFANAIMASIECESQAPELLDSDCSWDERARTITEHMGGLLTERPARGESS
jgi:hypothetical protein